MEVTSYKAGTPSYVDLGTPDPEGAKKFYGELFGWSFLDYGPEAGNYSAARLRDKAVAGLGPAQNPNMPPYWTTYITVDDVDITCKSVEQAGGTIVMPPMDVMDVGRMAVICDPVGAYVSVWQAGKSIGAEIVNEPGSLCWNDLNTRQPQKAIEFYTSVFGWKVDESAGDIPYKEWILDDRHIGGMFTLGPEMPADVPSHWAVYFCVANLDESVDKVKSLGGELLMGPMDIEPGRMAIVRDPQGASFDIIELTKV